MPSGEKAIATTPLRCPRRVTRSVPAAVAGGLAPVAEGVWKLFRLKGEPPLTRLSYWLSSQECTIDISKAKRELGYEPLRTHADGIEELRAAATPH